MAVTVDFVGYVFNDAGVAIEGATVKLFLENTTTLIGTADTTDGNGHWNFSRTQPHDNTDQYDIEITFGNSVRRLKYDRSEQYTTLEVKKLRIRNPANTFVYDIVPADIDTDDRVLTLPLITGTDTLMTLGLAQTVSGATTFSATVTGPSGTWDSGGMDIAASASYAVAGTAILSDSSGTMTLSNVDALDSTTEATIETALDTLSNLTTVGALNAGSITSGFTSIDVGSGALTTTGAISGATIDASTDFTIGTTVITDDVITFTPTTDDTVTMTSAANGAFSLVTVDTAAAAANVAITADGTFTLTATEVILGSSSGVAQMETNGITIGLAASAPAPDGDGVHIWDGTAGSVTAHTNADQLVVESSGEGGISILTPAGNTGILYFGDAASNIAGYIQYNHAAPRFQFGIEGSTTLNYAAGAFAFLEATTISSTAGLTLDPAAAVSFNNKNITNVGAAGNDWTANGVLTLKSASGGTTGPILNLYHDTDSAAVGDRIGVIDFLNTDGTIFGEINVTTEGSAVQAGFHFLLKGDATNDKLFITRDGNATLLGQLTETSDERLKDNVETLTSSLAKVTQMRGVSFTRNDFTDKTQKHVGLIAQELESIAPELVTTGSDDLKSVAYSQLVVYLIEAIKELDATVTTLKAE